MQKILHRQLTVTKAFASAKPDANAPSQKNLRSDIFCLHQQFFVTKKPICDGLNLSQKVLLATVGDRRKKSHLQRLKSVAKDTISHNRGPSQQTHLQRF